MKHAPALFLKKEATRTKDKFMGLVPDNGRVTGIEHGGHERNAIRVDQARKRIKTTSVNNTRFSVVSAICAMGTHPVPAFVPAVAA